MRKRSIFNASAHFNLSKIDTLTRLVNGIPFLATSVRVRSQYFGSLGWMFSPLTPRRNTYLEYENVNLGYAVSWNCMLARPTYLTLSRSAITFAMCATS